MAFSGWAKKTYNPVFGYDFSSEVYIHNTTDLTLGLASIKAYSKLDPHIKKNCQFINRVYIDSFSIKTITEDILSQNPDLVCFSVNVWNFEETKCIWESIKYINSNIKVILGGPMVPIDVQSSRKMLEDHKEIDALVRGEGEIAFRKLLNFYLKKEEISNIPNVALRKDDKIFTNAKTVSLTDLSELPSPYLSGDLNIYDNATNNANDKGIFILHQQGVYNGTNNIRVKTSNGQWDWVQNGTATCFEGVSVPKFKPTGVNRAGRNNKDKLLKTDGSSEFLFYLD